MFAAKRFYTLIITLIFSFHLLSQSTFPDHVFRETSSSTRAKLAYHGEKYAALTSNTQTFQPDVLSLYHPDFSHWKSIALLGSTSAMFVTDNAVNEDSLVEVVFSKGATIYTPSPVVVGPFFTYIINDKGTELGKMDGQFRVLQDGTNSRIVVTSNSRPITNTIYSLHGLATEKIYTKYFSETVWKGKDIKYTVFDSAAQVLSVYNSDHSLWKSISLSNVKEVSHASVDRINSDSLVEMIVRRDDGKYAVVNEQNESLFTAEDMISLSEMKGLENKLIVSSTLASMGSKIYHLPDFALEHQYANGQVKRTKLAHSGEVYYLTYSNAQYYYFEIYNANHSLKKKITQTVFVADGTTILNVSDTLFNSDPLIEILYVQRWTTGRTSVMNTFLINENATSLLAETTGRGATVNLLDGLSDVLIVDKYTNYTGPVTSTSVYRLPFDKQQLSIEAGKLESPFQVYPNPMQDRLHVSELTSQHRIQMFDVLGKLVLESSSSEVDVQHLPSGYYTLLIKGEKSKVAHKLLKE